MVSSAGPLAAIGIIGGPGRSAPDAGLEHSGRATHAEVLGVFAPTVERLRALLVAVVPTLPAARDCPRGSALDGIRLPFDLP